MSKPKTVKQSKKTASWFLAIAKDDEEALQAFELLRKRGCFNTRLWKWDTRDEMKLIRRWYIYPKQPAIEIQQRRLYGMMDLDEQQLAETLDRHQRMRSQWTKDNLKSKNKIIRLKRQIANLTNKDYEEEIFIRENLLANLEPENERLKQRVAQLEAENAELRKECLVEDGLYNDEDVERILKSSQYGSWIKTENSDEHPNLNTPNLNFVTPDMSATLGRGTHVLIDIDKVPKDLQVLLAKMMDALNDHTLRISQLENC